MKNIRKIIPMIAKILKEHDLNIENMQRIKNYIEQKENELQSILPLETEPDIYIPISNLSDIPKGCTYRKNSIVEQNAFKKPEYIYPEEIKQIIQKEKSKLFNLENEIFIINELINLIKRKYHLEL